MSKISSSVFLEEAIAKLFNKVGSLVVFINSEFKIVEFNREAETVFCLKREQCIGKSFLTLFVPEELHPFIRSHFEKVNRGKPTRNLELPLLPFENNPPKHVLLNFSRIHDADIILNGILICGQEITERKQNELITLEKSDKYYSLFNNAVDALFILEPYTDIILETNTKAEKLLGIPKRELQGTFFSSFFPTEKQNYLTLKFQELFNQNEGVLLDVPLNDSKQKQKNVDIYLSSIPIGLRELFMVTCKDITETKQLNQRIVQAAINAEEGEKKRLAQDLHDGLGPLLSAMNLYINALSSSVLSNKEQHFAIEKLKTIIDESIVTTREIAHNLMPTVMHDFGFIVAVKSFVKKINHNPNTQLQFSVTCNSIIRYPETTEIVLYRVLLELINNTIKHANAQKATISFTCKEKEIKIVYTDNGQGVDIEKTILRKRKNMGIHNIIHRIQSIGGDVFFKSNKGYGFYCQILINI